MLTVAAMGHRDDVLYNCYLTSYSWGFADGSDSVQRSICEISGANSNERLCWHTNGNELEFEFKFQVW